MMHSQEGVVFETADIAYDLKKLKRLKNWIKSAVRNEGRTPGNITIILCSDDYLLELNKQYLNRDYYTDIITFPYSEDPIDGELYISIDRIRDNAVNLGIPEEEELSRVIIHGVLHLLGYDDQTSEEKSQMTKKEDEYLQFLT